MNITRVFSYFKKYLIPNDQQKKKTMQLIQCEVPASSNNEYVLSV